MNFKKQVSLLTFFFILLSLCAHASDKLPTQVKNFYMAGQQPIAASIFQADARDSGYPWRGLLIGADHGLGNIHHDNIYVRINGGPIIYQTTIPARKLGNQLPDAGLLWHFYTRDDTEITIYATSAWVTGMESELSLPYPLYFLYPDPATCTEQTVPVSIAGEDQLVNVGSLVTLDGSLSYDPYLPDNDDLVYRWECYSAPESSVLLSDEGEAAIITFTPNIPGNYYFRFNVRDKKDDTSFNRSPVSYVRVSAVQDMGSQSYLNANAGRTQQVEVNHMVTLDGSQSHGSDTITSYTWTMENPLGASDIQNISNTLGTADCQGNCHQSNFDADGDVDGEDFALLAANYSGVELPDEPVVQFVAGIARPHIFRLTVGDGAQTDYETTIVAVNHENANPVLTHPFVENECLE
ncbi:MAG: hypothetical protein K8S13_03535 [Desulfobacula sp.]|uniref:PKD domain-containing protein n=1 Tax=Desulfobacula sp. TaxID=2593537 RepID=UPI0025BF7A9F|nr:REJ domain-containing protein [Desulfobacula sp.]MCD4718916.1 hypothetical protein [Desulfobacula sp.]